MIRFGLLGCGRIAKRHSELLGGNHIDGARLVAVCDTVRNRADAIASKFGVPALYDIDDFLARQDIDAVAVLTPSGMHPAHVIACAKAGKHAIVEKPMALRLQDADDMIRACDEAGVKLFVVKQNRFNVPVVKARGALEAGRFGRLILGTVRVAGAATRPITIRMPGVAPGPMTAACSPTRPATTSICWNGSSATSSAFTPVPSRRWQRSKPRTPRWQP
jgi:predicted dehydrogenase